MTALTPDPKPWKCTSCSDRFVRDQKNRSATHWTEFAPRAQYSQNREDYPA